MPLGEGAPEVLNPEDTWIQGIRIGARQWYYTQESARLLAAQITQYFEADAGSLIRIRL